MVTIQIANDDLPPTIEFSRAKIDKGRALYAHTCSTCHGGGTISSGLYPDLKLASRETHDQWNDIVLGGVRQAQGMASFADLLSVEDAEAIQAYIIERALHEPGMAQQIFEWVTARTCVPAAWLAD